MDVSVVVEGLTREERREIFDLAEDVHFERRVPVAPLAWSAEYARWMRSREYRIVSEIDADGIAL